MPPYLPHPKVYAYVFCMGCENSKFGNSKTIKVNVLIRRIITSNF